MIPVLFPESNTVFNPPPDLEESQCHRVAAWQGLIRGGSCDGAHMIVTAWLPSAEELALLNAGQPVFVSFIGGLPPHLVTVEFEKAIRPV